MTRRSRNLARSAGSAMVLVAAALGFLPGSISAQEVSQEEAPAVVEDTGDAPTSSQEVLDEVPGEVTAAELMTAPGGVPVGPIDAETAAEAVRASMAAAEQQAAAGVGDTYAIQFGDTFDWVRLASGEWIKGDLKRMRDEKVEFDSDKLDLLNIDFADVTHIHSPHVNTYVFDDRVSATGKAVITPDTVIVQTEEGTKTFPRSELESIIEGGEREREWWWMKLRFGLTYNRGNTDQLTYDVNFNTRREDRMTLLDLGYNATFGKTDGVQNVNRNLGELDFKVFLSSRWFVTPLFGQLLNDRFQNIRLRATPAAGAGVHIIDVPKVKWDFQTGFGYQYLKYKEDTAGVGNPQQDAFVPLYTYADFDITGDIDLTLSWLTNLVVTSIGRTNHTGKADLSIELTDVLDLDLAFLYLRTEQPAPPADPADPPIEKNDYQLVVGISLELG
jgi:putative salt-induced outer membrane protein YdiY